MSDREHVVLNARSFAIAPRAVAVPHCEIEIENEKFRKHSSKVVAALRDANEARSYCCVNLVAVTHVQE